MPAGVKEDNAVVIDGWENSEAIANFIQSPNNPTLKMPGCFYCGEGDLVVLYETANQSTSDRNYVVSVLNGMDTEANLGAKDWSQEFFGVCMTPVPGRTDSLIRDRGLSIATGGIVTVYNKDENAIIKAGKKLYPAFVKVEENGSTKFRLTFKEATTADELKMVRARSMSDADYMQPYQIKLID